MLSWFVPFLILLVVQYGVGEFLFIRKMNYFKFGYCFVVFFMMAEVIYGVYLYKFVEFMDYVGLVQLILASFLFHKFISRNSGAIGS